MRTKSLIFLFASVVFLGTASWFGADWAVKALEKDTEERVVASLTAAGETWAKIETDGLIVGLTGEAPSETARFRALEVAARIVDTNRIEDETKVKANSDLQLPDFSIEILRNGEELSLIGLVPGKQSRLDILQRMDPYRNEGRFTDLLESVEFDPPEGWQPALEFAILITERLQKSRIMVRPGGVTAEAFFEDILSSRATKKAIEEEKPGDIQLALQFSSPKSIVAPFRFVASQRDGKLIVKECWSDSETAKGQIYTALSDVGVEADCPTALGAPTPEWAGAIAASVKSLRHTQNADITITDVDVTLAGTAKTDLESFQTASAELEENLPQMFSFRSETPAHTAAPVPRSFKEPTFAATLHETGALVMSGPMRDTMSKEATESFAAAQFIKGPISADLSVAPNVPPGWSPRVLAALDALSQLHDGRVEMTMQGMSLQGRSAQEDASKLIMETLRGQVNVASVSIDVTHEPELAVVVSQTDLNAQECERQLAGILREAQIIFDPNSSTISEESEILIDEIAFIISSCPNAAFEIGGHTDSQGREIMNLNLSQSRADAVMDALLSREVFLDQLTAKGYGESEPIADNETENGRARNRRIAFKLMGTSEEADEQN